MKENIDFFSNYIILPFIKAWNLFFQVQLPLNRIYYDHTETDESHILCFIPIVGMVIGMIIYAFLYIMLLSTGTLVAAIISPLVIIIFVEYLNYSKDTSNLVNYITSKYAYYHKEPTEEKHHQQNKVLFYYVFFGIFLLRLLALGALIYFHRFSWIIVTFVLTFSIQGYLASKDDMHFNRHDLLLSASRHGIKIWITALIICILFGWVYFPAILFLLVISVFVGYKTKKIMSKCDALNGINIGIFGKIMEIVILLFGLLFRFNF